MGEAHPEHLMAQATRKASVVNRLCAGSTISHWSEQHLERMIKTNSVFQEHQDQLRQCWKDHNSYGIPKQCRKFLERSPGVGRACECLLMSGRILFPRLECAFYLAPALQCLS